MNSKHSESSEGLRAAATSAVGAGSEADSGGPFDRDPVLNGPVEHLTAEYLAALYKGDEPDATLMAERLPEEAQRAEFLELLNDTLRLQGLLPVQVVPGTLLNERYRILGELGSGGMGKVFEARDEQLDRKVAVKVLAVFGQGAFDPEQQFHNEARQLAGLQHPNIVTVHEIGSAGDVHYLVMDRVRGVALSEVLERVQEALVNDPDPHPRSAQLLVDALGDAADLSRSGALTESSWFRAVARLSVELARTLEAAHNEGLVHRDVKPQNIMLRGDASPVLLDFGLAGLRNTEGGEITRGLFGSVAYIAPEQANSGMIGSDPRSDVYQLGTVLYEMLTLLRAYPGRSITDLLRHISQGDFVAPRLLDRGIPAELEAICLRAMAAEPDDRYASARELREDLERWIEGRELPLAARRDPMQDLKARWVLFARRRRAALLSAAVLAVIVAVGMWKQPWLNAEVVLSPFRYTAASNDGVGGVEALRGRSGQALVGSDVKEVRERDLLGVVLESETPRFVYALSVFGARSPPSWVAPMTVQDLDQLRAVPRPEDSPTPSGSGHWFTEVPAGLSQLVCTEVGAYDAAVPYEGLWVFTSTQRLAGLEAWLESLQQRLDASGAAGVPLSEARRAFLSSPRSADITALRGSRVEELGVADRRALEEQLTAALILGEDDWPFTDPSRFEIVLPVAP
ncbi:MAG: hypothetical protein DHS20C15_29560 [Planctomycetota bacterium]|nr:MAG: hypothetical protein DHS20C15_29560 [Planctomycetota bacterium]